MKVRGLINPRRRLSEAAVAALDRGDIDELLRINREEFGHFRMMADGDDDDDDDNDDNDDDTGGDGDDGDDDDVKSKKKSDSDKDDDDDDGDDSEKEKLRKRMKAADKRASEAERKLREREDEDKSELEKAQSRVSEIEEENTTLKGQVNSLRLENAFLTANKHSWHDPDVALSLAQSKKYLDDVVDDDGEVDKKELSKSLDRLAKEHPYLVAKEDKSEEDDLPESGSSGGGRSDNSKDAKARKQQLRGRFPVLNR